MTIVELLGLTADHCESTRGLTDHCESTSGLTDHCGATKGLTDHCGTIRGLNGHCGATIDDALFWIQMEIVTYSSVSENIYMDKKNNHDSLFIVSREPKLRFSADHRGYQ